MQTAQLKEANRLTISAHSCEAWESPGLREAAVTQPDTARCFCAQHCSFALHIIFLLKLGVFPEGERGREWERLEPSLQGIIGLKVLRGSRCSILPA